MNSITDEDVKKASLLQKTTATSQLIDKALAIDNKGKSQPQIVINQQFNRVKDEEAEMEAKLREIEAELGED